MVLLSDWLLYLEKLPTGLAVKNKISFDNTKKIADFFDLGNFSCPVITIAGTNGKGSCVAFLDTIWRAQGYSVGSYTSPHLIRYNERICINGAAVSDEMLVEVFSSIDSVCQKLEITLNYFAFTTIAALLIFKFAPLDVILLEVGIGGRLDPVNIISPDISVITTIALDHIDCLGNSREEIGFEKSGIMRKNVPVVSGDNDPPLSIYHCAKQSGAMLFCLHKDFDFSLHDNSWIWHYNKIKSSSIKTSVQISDLPIPLLPTQNAATSLMVIELLQKRLPVSHAALIQGLKKTFLPGRFQWLKFCNDVKCVVDVAHNGESSLLLASNLKSNFCQGQTLGVVSVLQDKNIIDIIKPLIDLVDEWYVCQLPANRAASLQQLQNVFLSLGLRNVRYFANPTLALDQALQACKAIDRIVSFGSFYMVAEVLKYKKNLEKLHGA